MHSLFMKELSTCSLGLMKLVHEIDLLLVNIERKVSSAHCFCRLIRLLLFLVLPVTAQNTTQTTLICVNQRKIELLIHIGL